MSSAARLISAAKKFPSYTAGDWQSSNTTWVTRPGGGHQLEYNHNHAPAEQCIFAKVSNDRLQMTPDGNANARYMEQAPISKAKYALSLECPNDAEDKEYAVEWAKAIANLQAKERAIAQTAVRKNLFKTDAAGTFLRLSAPVFQKVRETYKRATVN